MISLPSNVDNKISSAIRYCANIHLCINFTQFLDDYGIYISLTQTAV